MRWLYLLVALICMPLAASEWQMLFPVYQQGIEIANLNAVSDGSTVSRISGHDLRDALGPYLSEDVVSWLTSVGDDNVPDEALREHGILLTFNKNDLAFNLEIQADSNAVNRVSLDGPPEKFIYSESAYWTWQNTLNLTSTYEDDFEQTAEWLGYLNVAGYDGINMDWSLYYEAEDESESIYRGPVQLFVDRPANPWRYTFGDVSADIGGNIDSTTLGGFSWTRNYDELQPTRQIQNTGMQPIDLRESAEVNVFINDSLVSRLRLSPGRYNLNDLPLSSGTNNIRLEIRYQSGATETITYDQFYYARLLPMGTDDFGIHTGFVYDYDSDNIVYQSTPVAVGFYEYGLTDEWTLGINGLNHEDGHLIGGLVNTSQAIGTLSMRATTGYLEDGHAVPYSLSLDYSQRVWGSSSYGSPNLSIGLAFESDFTSTPWEDDSQYTGNEYSLQYTTEIDDYWSTNLYGYYLTELGSSDEHTARFKLSWSRWNVQVTGSVEHTADDDYPDGEIVYAATFQWFWYSSGGDYSASAYYDSEYDTTQVELAKNSNGYVGDWSATAYYEEGSDTEQAYMQAGYVANRMSGDLTVGTSSSQDYAELQLTTAIAVVDGELGIGKQVSGPLALVSVHDSLDADVLINDGAGDHNPESIATSTLSGIVPLSNAHTASEVEVNSYDAPAGYDIGPGHYTFYPGTYTGHVIEIGSDASKTVIGTLMDENGEPVSLQSGSAIMDDRVVRFFTNKKGRYVLEGIGPGVYTITIDGDKKHSAEVIIADDNEMLLYLPQATLKKEKSND